VRGPTACPLCEDFAGGKAGEVLAEGAVATTNNFIVRSVVSRNRKAVIDIDLALVKVVVYID
jgi:hypothetical protein